MSINSQNAKTHTLGERETWATTTNTILLTIFTLIKVIHRVQNGRRGETKPKSNWLKLSVCDGDNAKPIKTFALHAHAAHSLPLTTQCQFGRYFWMGFTRKCFCTRPKTYQRRSTQIDGDTHWIYDTRTRSTTGTQCHQSQATANSQNMTPITSISIESTASAWFLVDLIPVQVCTRERRW